MGARAGVGAAMSAAKLLCTVARNLLDFPAEEKFRSLKVRGERRPAAPRGAPRAAGAPPRLPYIFLIPQTG